MLAKAEIEINIGNPDKALKNIEQAMKIESVNNIKSNMGEMLKLKGMAYLKTGKYDLAEDQFKKSYNFVLNMI